MPGHTAAHERASKTYNRSRNQGGVKVSGSTKRKTTTTKSNNNRTRIQDEKQKEFEKTYQANEFSGTGKTVDTSKYRDLRLNRFYQGGEVKTPIISLKPFEKVLKKGSIKTRKFFADPDNTNLLGTKRKISVLDAGKFKYKGKILTRSDFESMSAAQQEETYKTYLSERQSGMIDAYGNPGSATRGGSDNDAPPILEKKVVGGQTLITEAPTATEIAEKEEAEKYDARKTKKRGRRRLIFQQGTSKDFTLSKPILLGV